MVDLVSICGQCRGETLPHCARFACGWTTCPNCNLIYSYNGRSGILKPKKETNG